MKPIIQLLWFDYHAEDAVFVYLYFSSIHTKTYDHTNC